MSADLIQQMQEAIGGALVHSVWQSAIIAGLLSAALMIIPDRLSRMRYGLAYFALILSFVMLLLTFGFYVSAPITSDDIAVTVITVNGDIVSEAGIRQAANFSLENFVHHYNDLIVMLWVCGFSIMSGNNILSFKRASGIVATANPSTDPQWHSRFDALVEQSCISAPVKLLTSPKVSFVCTMGFFKPVIIVPVGFFLHLSQDEAEAVLAHEIAHILNNDFLLNIVQLIVTSVMFFNPAIYVINRTIHRERELACDDFAVRTVGHKQPLARALGKLSLASVQDNAVMLSATNPGHGVVHRMRRLLGHNVRSNWSLTSRLGCAALVTVMIGLCVASAQIDLRTQATTSNLEIPDQLAAESLFTEQHTEEALADFKAQFISGLKHDGFMKVDAGVESFVMICLGPHELIVDGERMPSEQYVHYSSLIDGLGIKRGRGVFLRASTEGLQIGRQSYAGLVAVSAGTVDDRFTAPPYEWSDFENQRPQS